MARPRLVLFIIGAFAVSCAFFIPKIKLELRMYDIADPRFPSTEKLRDFAEEFNEGNSVFFIVYKKSNLPINQGDYCQVHTWLNGQRHDNPYLQSTLGPSDLIKAEIKDNQVHYLRRLQLKCDHLTSKEELLPVDFSVFKGTVWEKNIARADGQDFLIQFTFRDLESGLTDESHFDPHRITEAYESFKKEVIGKNPSLGVHVSGRSTFQWYQWQAIVKDLWVNGLLSVLLILLFRLVLGTWKSGFLFVGTASLTGIITFGTMSIFKFPVDTLSNSLFPMLCIAGLEDFVFVTTQLQNSPQNWRLHFKRFLIPGFFTSFTTVIGFLSLEFSDLSIIRRFGLCAAFGALIEWTVVFFALPALLSVTGWARSLTGFTPETVQIIIKKFKNVAIPRAVARGAVACGLLACFVVPYLVFDSSPRNYFPENHPQRDSYDYTKSTRGWEAILNIVFRDMHRREDNEQLLAKARELANVSEADSPYAFMDDLVTDLPPQFAEQVRIDARLSPHFWRVFSPWDQARGAVYLKNFDLLKLDETIAQLRALCVPEKLCEVVGEGVVFSEFSAKVVNTLFSSFSSCLLLTIVVILFLKIALRGPMSNLPAMLLSLIWAPLIIIGVLGVFQIPINYFNSMFATILVSLTGDNAIQYLFAARRRSVVVGTDSRGGSSVIVTLIAMATSICFLGMTPLPLKQLGVLLFLGFLASMVGDLWLLKGLLKKPGFIKNS